MQLEELGNEPELYGRFPWYQTNGHGVRTRPRDYGPADFTQEFARVAMAVPHVSLAGPATGAPDWWRVYLPQFVRGAPRLRLLTLHRYATHGCFVTPRSPQYHTIRNLLSVAGTQGLAASVADLVSASNTRCAWRA